MKIPGTRYLDYSWRDVKKLLVDTSLNVIKESQLLDQFFTKERDPYSAEIFADELSPVLFRKKPEYERLRRGDQEWTTCEGAYYLALEIKAYQVFFGRRFLKRLRENKTKNDASPADGYGLPSLLSEFFSELRYRVDAQGYMVATGRNISASELETYAHLDEWSRDVLQILQNPVNNHAQAEFILGHEIFKGAQPIEGRLSSPYQIKPEWLIRWSESHHNFKRDENGKLSIGPLHTKKKIGRIKKVQEIRLGDLSHWPIELVRFYDLVDMLRDSADEYKKILLPNADAIREMLTDLACWDTSTVRYIPDIQIDEDTQSLFDNLGELGSDVAESGVDRITPSPWADDEDDSAPSPLEDVSGWGADLPTELPVTEHKTISLSDRWTEASGLDTATEMLEDCLQDHAIEVRIAVHSKLIDDADPYPDDWLDPEMLSKGVRAFPSTKSLAACLGVSIPTLEKRRDAAITLFKQRAMAILVKHEMEKSDSAPEDVSGGGDELPTEQPVTEHKTISLSDRWTEASGLDTATEMLEDCLQDHALEVRIAVHSKLIDDADPYPDDWLDPEMLSKGVRSFPSTKSLAASLGVSIPTLEKRRDAAITLFKQRAMAILVKHEMEKSDAASNKPESMRQELNRTRK